MTCAPDGTSRVMSICHVFDYSKIVSKVILAGAGAWGGSQSTPKGYRVHLVCQVSLLIHLTLLKHCNKFISMAFRRIQTIR